MSTTVAIVLGLSFVLGLINQAISQGSILGGTIKVPPTWLPWLTVAASFLGGAVMSLQAASAAGSITAQAVVNAVLAGLAALGAAGGGIGIALHMTKKTTAAMRACTNCGKSPGESPAPSPPKSAA
jgi:hypothetical protein